MDFNLNLDSDTVDHCGCTEPVCVAPEESVREVFGLMRHHNRGAVLIVHEQRLIGIFTERDALRMMANGAELDVPIENVMVREPVTLNARESIGSAIAKMSKGGYRQLPIVDDHGKPLGMQLVSDILHYLVQHFPGIIYNLPPAPNPTQDAREGA